MSRRIHFTAWGVSYPKLRLPAYAMRPSDKIYGGEREWVCRAIERKTGLHVVTCRPDGVSQCKDLPDSRHYQLTLGRPCRGGGWSPEAELWVAIPVRKD